MFFSVIVPIYKVEPYLHKCVDSILAQTFTDFELILVDDGSPDGCGRICDGYAQADPRVCVIHKPNGGLVSARNTGLKKSRGQYILYVDGDDWVSNLWLETIQKQIKKSPEEPDLVIFYAEKVYRNRRKLIPQIIPDGYYDKERLRKKIYPYLMWDKRLGLGTGILYPAAWNRAYRRSLLLKHYCRDERISLGTDGAFTIECVLCARNLIVCSDILYYYNKTNPGSMLTAHDPDRALKYKYLFEYLQKRLGNRSACLDRQLNGLIAGYICNIFSCDARCTHVSFLRRRKSIAKGFAQTHLLRFLTPKGLPAYSKVFLGLLHLHCYGLALLLAKLRNLFQ